MLVLFIDWIEWSKIKYEVYESTPHLFFVKSKYANYILL